MVAEITTTIRSIPLEVLLLENEGLATKCAANFDNLRTISQSALVRRAGTLSKVRHKEVKRAVGYALGWEELILTADQIVN